MTLFLRFVRAGTNQALGTGILAKHFGSFYPRTSIINAVRSKLNQEYKCQPLQSSLSFYRNCSSMVGLSESRFLQPFARRAGQSKYHCQVLIPVLQ